MEATVVPPLADPVARPPVDPLPTVALSAVEPTTILSPSDDGPGSPGGTQPQTDQPRPALPGTDPTVAAPRQGETAPPSVDPTLSAVVTEPSAAPAAFTPATGPVDAGTGTTGGSTSNPNPTSGPTSGVTSPVSSTITAPTSTGPAPGGADAGRLAGAGAQRPEPPSPATYRSVMQALNPGMPLTPPTDPTRQPEPGDWEHLRPRTPEWYAAKWAAEREGLDRRRYQGYFEAQRAWFEENQRTDEATRLRSLAEDHDRRAREYSAHALTLRRAGQARQARAWDEAAEDEFRDSLRCLDLAQAVSAGTVVPDMVSIDDEADFRRINDDVADLAPGAVDTGDRSALTGDGHPPTIDRSRRYGVRGGLRPPLALHQTDLERQMPRDAEGQVVRTADPRQGGWFRLANDGGPRADPTRGINCIDCTLSFFETWVHGRPRVAAPRTFDAYAEGDIRAPLGGEEGGTGRIEDVTGGRFQRLCTPPDAGPAAVAYTVDLSYRNLHDQLRLGGHGSLAFVVHEWEGGGSHIWVAVNQNGTILYLDPQTNLVADRPLYGHAGFPHAQNVTGLDVLVLGPDGRPMPMGGLQRGRYSDRPDLPEYPPAPDHRGYGEPYINRLHLLDGPGSAIPAPRPGDSPARGASESQPTGGKPDPGRSSLRDLVLAAADLDALRVPTVNPAHLAAELDAPTLRRLVPHLDEQDAQNAARLFADARVRQMLADVTQSPPKEHPQLAATLVAQLARQPDLVRIILGTPELAVSLTARPVTLHNLAKHQQAIDALTEVLDDIETGRHEELAADDGEGFSPPPLTASQRAISASVGSAEFIYQPGFDFRRREDSDYVADYLSGLYVAAAEAQHDLNRLAVELADLKGDRVGVPGWRSVPKLRTRAEDKVVRYEGDASRLWDLAAAKVEFRRLDHLYQALGRLRDHPQIEIVSFEDRFLSPQKSGYRDLQLVLRMPNGHLGEFRLHLAQIDEVAVWEHALFEVRRDLEALARRDGRQLTHRENLIMDGVRRYQRKCFEDALRSACEGGP
ncbi:hypothetical protein E1091_08770 [Micromonospora fluostatini]|uniref:Tox-PL domain-containing protein n=1 Tax=Micromonospora fluostatini TaxID=1629071 RepID=A0ABY2DHM0_9ACTN|nr:hypothetical protein E1091_08770 [Micromonospora fluostatini]